MADHHDAELAVQQILKCKWTMAILASIAAGVQRPADLLRACPGLSHKVLDQRLAKLVRLRVAVRAVVSERPRHVSYALSDFGADIRRVIDAVAEVQRAWDARRQQL